MTEEEENVENRFTDVVWPGWEVVRKLGEGSFGGVYEIQRTLPDGQVEKGALKKLTLPRNADEIEELRSNQFDDASITAHFSNQLKSLVSEYGMMKKLSGCPNIVHSLDLRYIQHDDGIGWDLYIRMELLTPLKKVLIPEYNEQTVLNLGTDLCSALIACEKEHIIHRDIKPENILVSDGGVYKLGDFGVAKVAVENGTGTITGTTGYMAPEISKHEAYGPTVDIYSLGMVLYWMMNERTLPFLPLPPQIPTAMQRQEATNRRFRGEPLPAPKNGSEGLKQVILKACAYKPEDRYQTAAEMLEALEGCTEPKKNTQPEPKKSEPTPKQPPVPQAPPAEKKTTTPPAAKAPKTKRVPLMPILAGATAVVCLIGAILIFGQKKKPSPVQETMAQTRAEETTQTKSDNQDKEPILELTLTPDKNASYSDVKHDSLLIEKRILALSAEAEISMNDETGEINATIPMTDVGYGNNVENIIRATISRRQVLFLERYLNRYQIMYDDEYGIIDREDIVEVYQTTAGEMNKELGMPLEVESASGDPLALEDSQPCIYLKLTQERVDKMYTGFDQDGTDTFGFDTTVSNSVSFPYTYQASDGLTFVLVPSSWKEESLTRAIVCGLSNDVLNKGYTYQYAITPEAFWEKREEGKYFGQEQCEFEELEDPDNTVSIRLQMYNYSEVSDSLVEQTIRQMKDKMDIIGLPYALGRDVQSEDTVVICTNPKRLNADLLKLFTDSISLHVEYTDIYAWNMTIKNIEIVPIENSGKIGLQVQYTKAEAVEDVTSRLRWKDDKSLYYGGISDPMVSTQITTTISDDTILFDQFPMMGQSSIDEQYGYILKLIAYNLQAKRTGVNVFCNNDYKFNSENAHFGLSATSDEDQKIVDYIREKYPEFSVRMAEDKNKCLYVFMNAEIRPKFYENCFDQVEQIFKECKLDESDLNGAVFLLIDEKEDQRCRLVFTRYPWDTYMSCTGNCRGDMLDVYKEDFSNNASWRLFFQKRNFEMYGS